MSYIITTLGNLVQQSAFFGLTWGNFLMIGVALFFLFLAIKKGYEPLLLVPISFGMLLVNMYPDIMLTIEDSNSGVGGLLHYFYLLDEWSILRSLIFLGVGAMTDFGPLIANPKSFLLGAAAQFGYLQLILWQSLWDFLIKQLQQFLLLVEPMVLHRFSLLESLGRQNIWDQLRLRHIPICHLFQLFSRQL